MDLWALPCWECGFQSRRGLGCLSLVIVLCCQVEVSRPGRSFIQRSHTECGVSECDGSLGPLENVAPWKKLIYKIRPIIFNPKPTKINSPPFFQFFFRAVLSQKSNSHFYLRALLLPFSHIILVVFPYYLFRTYFEVYHILLKMLTYVYCIYILVFIFLFFYIRTVHLDNVKVFYHHHHIFVMELGHLLTRFGLTHLEVSSEVCHNSFCQLENSVSLPWVIYYEAFYLHVVSSFSCTPVICSKLVLFSIPL